MTDQIKRKLQEEINTLEHELIHELPKENKKATALCDISENAEYHRAKQRQSRNGNPQPKHEPRRSRRKAKRSSGLKGFMNHRGHKLTQGKKALMHPLRTSVTSVVKSPFSRRSQ